MTENSVQPNIRSQPVDPTGGMATIPAMPKRGPYKKIANKPPPQRRMTNIGKWRKFFDQTQQEAADGAGLSTGNISAMENADQDYVQDSLDKLAKHYGIPAGWLIDVDPFTDDIWMLFHKANKLQKAMITDMAKRIVQAKR